MIPNSATRKLGSIRRKYVNAVKSDDAELVDELRGQLIELQDQEFLEKFDQRREAFQSFVGGEDKSKREKIFNGISSLPKILDNFVDVVKTDSLDSILGRKQEKGKKKESFVNRLLGADKFFTSTVSDSVSKSNSTAGIETNNNESITSAIESFEKSDTKTSEQSSDSIFVGLSDLTEKVSELVDLFKDSLEFDRKQARQLKRSQRESSRESLGTLNSKISSRALKKQRRGIGLPSKGILSQIGDLIPGGAVGKGVVGAAGLAGGVGIASKAGSIVKGITSKVGPVLSKSAGFAAKLAGPIVGIGMGVLDGISGWAKAKDWETGKVNAAASGILGGTDDGLMGAFKNGSKWAGIGAGIGSVVPIVGTIAGGLIGGAVGGVLGFFGGEKISKMFSSVGDSITDAASWLTSSPTGKPGDSFADDVQLLVKGPVDAVKDIFDGTSAVISDAVDTASSFGSDIFNATAEKAAGFVGVNKTLPTLNIQHMEEQANTAEAKRTALETQTALAPANPVSVTSVDNSQVLNQQIISAAGVNNDSRSFMRGAAGIRGSENSRF